MKKILLTVVLLLATAFTLSAQQTTTGVAIMKVVDEYGNVSGGVKLNLRATLAYAINHMPGYEAYTRVYFPSIEDEQKFQRSGYVDDNQIKEIGKATGAKYILVAEAAIYDATHITITASIIDIETTKIRNTSNPEIAPIDSEGMKESCIKIARSLLNMNKNTSIIGDGASRQIEEKKWLEEERRREQLRKEREERKKQEEREKIEEKEKKQALINRSYTDLLLKKVVENATTRFSNGGFLIGNWKNGFLLEVWDNGDFYIGWRDSDGKRTNYGLYVVGDNGQVRNCPGSIAYVGPWWKNNKQGEEYKGCVYNRDGKIIYYGSFMNDEPQYAYPSEYPHLSSYKFRVSNYDNGDKYIGEIKDGKKHGMGLYIWKNGGIYGGYWENDKRTYKNGFVERYNNQTAAVGGYYVDLGLPSGTLWKTSYEEMEYDYSSALSKFGKNMPTESQRNELIDYCRWTYNDNGVKAVGPNGNSLFLPWTAVGGHVAGGAGVFFWIYSTDSDSDWGPNFTFCKDDNVPSKSGSGLASNLRKVLLIKTP